MNYFERNRQTAEAKAAYEASPVNCAGAGCQTKLTFNQWRRGRVFCGWDCARPHVDAAKRQKRVRPWYCYVVRCGDASFYTGVTTDIDRRIRQHNSKRGGCAYTRSRRPVVLVYRETVQDRATAQVREAEIKRMTREQKLMLIGHYGGNL